MTLRIAMAQFDFPVGDVAGNRDRIAAMIAEARDEHGADVVLFPELALSGYPPEDLVHRPAFLQACEEALAKLAKACTACHSFEKGGPNKVGPNLWGIVNNKHAHAEGFAYSDAMKSQEAPQPLLIRGHRAAGVVAGLQLLPVALDQARRAVRVGHRCNACAPMECSPMATIISNSCSQHGRAMLLRPL